MQIEIIGESHSHSDVFHGPCKDNFKNRQMDCIYCGIRKQMLLQEDALNSNFLYEYTVCLYENYMAKLFHSICAMYDLESQVRVEIWII